MNCAEIQYEEQKATLREIIQHLSSASSNFVPPLETYIDINKYARKIIKYSVTFEAWNKSELVGLAAVYFNNENTRIGFCTNLSVLKEFQGMGIGTDLMNRVLNYGKGIGFIRLDLETKFVNKKAISFYKNFGFFCSGIHDDSLYFSYILSNCNE